MSENFDELGELGDKIKKIIDTAVSTKDYRQMTEDIKQTVGQTVGRRSGAVSSVPSKRPGSVPAWPPGRGAYTGKDSHPPASPGRPWRCHGSQRHPGFQSSALVPV